VAQVVEDPHHSRPAAEEAVGVVGEEHSMPGVLDSLLLHRRQQQRVVGSVVPAGEGVGRAVASAGVVGIGGQAAPVCSSGVVTVVEWAAVHGPEAVPPTLEGVWVVAGPSLHLQYDGWEAVGGARPSLPVPTRPPSRALSQLEAVRGCRTDWQRVRCRSSCPGTRR